MNGQMSLEEAITERLSIINCTPADIQRFLTTYPAESRLVPGAKQLITTLQARGIAVYLISGGFRELCLPIAKAMGVPYAHVYANRMNWQVDDETGMPTKLVGFDERELTGHGMGKPRVIEVCIFGGGGEGGRGAPACGVPLMTTPLVFPPPCISTCSYFLL